MPHICPRLSVIVFSLILSIRHLAAAEPVQYCKFGDPRYANERVDFCVGAVLHRNTSTSSHDLLLSFTHTRHEASKIGWTAIGLGKLMKGSLMFIVYGDPMSHEAPLVSIRGAKGHHQPTLVTQEDVGGADLRIVETIWVKSTRPSTTGKNSDYVAKVNLICYSCALWPGTEISATTKSQPWIWAWNPTQDFQVYSFDARLTMHTHHTSPGGFGNFYVDMARAINNVPGPVSLPPIRPRIATLGTSETPGGSVAAIFSVLLRPALHLHAILMGLAFSILFPAGVVAMRSGATKAFKYHWVLQLAGSGSILLGMLLGLFMRSKVDTVHQSIGIAIAVAVGLQGVLGWRHHVKFLEVRHRTWLSNAHISLGRWIMVVGWSNVVIGMMLYGYSIGSMVTVSALGFCEIVAIIFRARRHNSKRNVAGDSPHGPSEETRGKKECFALARDSTDE